MKVVEIIYDGSNITKVFEDGSTIQEPYSPPVYDLSQLKQDMVNMYTMTIKTHVQSQYSELKQRSDVADKEYYSSWLVTNVVNANSNNPAYTTDEIYKKAFIYGTQIWYGSKTLKQILTDIQTNELPNLNPAGTYGAPRTSWEQEFLFAWEQLIKIAVRVAFVQACKNVYRQVKSQIEQAQTLQELSSISMPALPSLPQEFR